MKQISFFPESGGNVLKNVTGFQGVDIFTPIDEYGTLYLPSSGLVTIMAKGYKTIVLDMDGVADRSSFSLVSKKSILPVLVGGVLIAYYFYTKRKK